MANVLFIARERARLRASVFALLAVSSCAVTSMAGAQTIRQNIDTSLANATTNPACETLVADRASMSRERLVLNGAPSALERIRMNQRNEAAAAEAPAPSPQSILMRSLANRPVVDPIAPASRTSLQLGEVRAQPAADPCAVQRASALAEAFRSGRGTLMGTMPIQVRRTAFDDRWNRVNRAPPLALMQTHLSRAGVTDGMAQDEVLARVNRWVNQHVAYVADDINYGERDYWASAAETLSKMSGDCEDYAVLKMHMVRAAGFGADRVKLMLLRDLAGNRDHAFLVVTTPNGEVVLDNTTDRVYAASAATAVRPVLSFSGTRSWVHAVRNSDGLDYAFESVPASASL
jgi:predicted transglutaminase-like cysteine proteinase